MALYKYYINLFNSDRQIARSRGFLAADVKPRISAKYYIIYVYNETES